MNAIEKWISENDLSEWTILGEYGRGRLVNRPAKELMDLYRAECSDSHKVVADYGDTETLNALSALLDTLLGEEGEAIIISAIDAFTDLAHNAACEALDAQVYDGDIQEFGPLTEDRIVQEGNEIGVWVAKNGGQTWCPLAEVDGE